MRVQIKIKHLSCEKPATAPKYGVAYKGARFMINIDDCMTDVSCFGTFRVRRDLKLDCSS